jgi:steroid 5-alpha reductase family enzyme
LKEPYKTGFICSGVWSRSRHPNYFSEQAIWASVYIFSIAATGRVINWTMIGSLLLMLLFQGSADFSEGISAEKYPAYKEYCKKTPKFIPRLF